MSKSTLEQVHEWHSKFNAPINDTPDAGAGGRADLRLSLLSEELEELREAVADNDITGVLDALTDLQYVLDGAYLEFGVWKLKEEAFEEVQRSNMSKLGADGKPILREDGKILKGPDYFPPDLSKFLK